MTEMDARRQIVEVRILELEAKRDHLQRYSMNLNFSLQAEVTQAQIDALEIELKRILEVQRIVADIMMEEELNG